MCLHVCAKACRYHRSTSAVLLWKSPSSTWELDLSNCLLCDSGNVVVSVPPVLEATTVLCFLTWMLRFELGASCLNGKHFNKCTVSSAGEAISFRITVWSKSIRQKDWGRNIIFFPLFLFFLLKEARNAIRTEQETEFLFSCPCEQKDHTIFKKPI